MRRWEYVSGESAKFWEAGRAGTTVTITFGRSGTGGQTMVKEFAAEAEAIAYLDKVIGEKEKKGYLELTEAEPSTSSPETGVQTSVPGQTSVPEETGIPDESTEFPDETTFTLPPGWRRVLKPRRGGVPGPRIRVDGDPAEAVRQRIAEARNFFEEALANPASDSRLVEEAQGYLDGAVTVLGAATVAVIAGSNTRKDLTVFADAWVSAHGLAFAAEAAAEVSALETHWTTVGHRHTSRKLRFRGPGYRLPWSWSGQAIVDRMRAYLAAAGEQDYLAAVEALARCRRNESQRIVVAYLVPTQTDWVTECCATPPGSTYGDATDRAMLFSALGSEDQLATLGKAGRFGWGQWTLSAIATVADGVGPAIAPMLVGALDDDSNGAGARKLVLKVLSELPTDEAFEILLARLDQKGVQPAVLAAARHYPLRALRLFAEASGRSSKNATIAGQLLRGHLLRHPDLTKAALPGLAAPARAIVESQLVATARLDEAPADALPRLLVDPPWTRRQSVVTPVVIKDLEPLTGPSIAWAPGEREEWSNASSYYARWDSCRPGARHRAAAGTQGARRSRSALARGGSGRPHRTVGLPCRPERPLSGRAAGRPAHRGACPASGRRDGGTLPGPRHRRTGADPAAPGPPHRSGLPDRRRRRGTRRRGVLRPRQRQRPGAPAAVGADRR